MKERSGLALSFQHSMRQSSDTTQSICMSTVNGLFWTLDKFTIRLWSISKQIKSAHFPLQVLEDRHILGSFLIDSIDSCAIIFTPNDRSSEEKSFLQIWSSQLLLTQQVELNTLPLRRFSISPNQCDILLIDANCDGTILNLLPVSNNSPKKMKFTTYLDPVKNEDLKTKELKVAPTLIIEEMDKFSCTDNVDVKDCILTSDNIISYVDKASVIYILKDIPPLIPPPTKKKSKFSLEDENDEADDDEPEPDPNLPPRYHYELYKKINVESLENTDIYPTCLQRLDSRHYLIGYNDGIIRVIRVPLDPRMSKKKKDATFKDRIDVEGELLLEITAHAETSNRLGVTSLRICDWKFNTNNIYDVEFISSGDDMRVAYWGLKFKNILKTDNIQDLENSIIETSLISAELEANLLGDYEMPVEPQSHVASYEIFEKKAAPRHIIPYELSYLGSPCRKRFLCSYGGMMSIFDVYEPRIVLKSLPRSNIIFSTSGPLYIEMVNEEFNYDYVINQFENSETGEMSDDISTNKDNDNERKKLKRIIIILTEDCVEFVSPYDGTCLYQFQTTNISINGQQVKPLTRNYANRIVFEHDHKNVKILNSKPTCVHWCNFTKVLIIGFSSGELVILKNIINTSSNPNGYIPIQCEYVDSLHIHGNPITKINSFRIPSESVFRDESWEKFALIVGDSIGMLSTWKLRRGNPINLIWNSSSHSGKIIDISVFAYSSDPLDLRSIVTGCTSGFIKTWEINFKGELAISSYFKTIESSLSSVSSVPFISYQSVVKDKASSLLPGASETSQLAKMLGISATATITFSIICGFLTGKIEIWIISNDNTKCSSTPYVSFNDNPSPVTNIFECGLFKEVTSENERIFSNIQCDSMEIYCGSSDGKMSRFIIYESGRLNRIGFSVMPNSINNMIAANENDSIILKKSYTCFVIGDNVITEFLTINKGCIPSKWINLINAIDLSPKDRNRTTIPKLSKLKPKLCDTNFRKLNKAKLKIIPIESQNNSAITDDILNNNDNNSFNVKDFKYSLDQIKKIEISLNKDLSKDSMVFTKKNGFLIEQFKKFDNSNSSFISIEETVDIVHNWIGMDKVDLDNIIEIIQLLDYKLDIKIQFLDLAKISAVVSTVIGFRPGKTVKGNNIFANYNYLRSKKKKVTYNSIGEKVVELTPSIPCPHGLAKVYTETIRKKWNKVIHRTKTRFDDEKVPFPVTLLRVLPPNLVKLLSIDVKLSSVWSPNNEHWFDLRRTIRICRTLLDIRSTKQYEFYTFKNETGREDHRLLPNMTELLVNYFENSYGGGGGGFNVAAQKAVNFHEACLQYSQFSVINFMKRLLCPEVSSEVLTPTSLWLYIEGRSFLTTIAAVEKGEEIPIYSNNISTLNKSATLFAETSIKSKSSVSANKSEIYWHIVTRRNAIECVDEMLRKRGNYGRLSIEKVFSIVENLPKISKNDLNEDMIDFESFLEVLVIEYVRIEQDIKDLEYICFGREFTASANPQYKKNIYTYFKEFIYSFTPYDRLRNGTVDRVTFKSIIHHFSLNTYGFVSNPSDITELTDICLENFMGNHPDDPICYVDLWTLILAWLMHTKGYENFTCINLIYALKEITRGIEDYQALSVVNLIDIMQNPRFFDPLWTCAKINKFSISNDSNPLANDWKLGNWKIGATRTVADQPGLLNIQKINSSIIQNPITGNKVLENNEQNSVQYLQPTILSSFRNLSTLSGDVCKPLSLSVIKQDVPLICHDITSAIVDPAADANNTGMSYSLAMSRKFYNKNVNNYSRKISSMDEKTVDENYNIETAINNDYANRSEFSSLDGGFIEPSEDSYNVEQEFQMSSNFNPVATSSSEKIKIKKEKLKNNSSSLLFTDTLAGSVSSSAVEKLRLDMIMKETEMSFLVQQEKMIFEKRAKLRKQEKRRLRREARQKYQDYMDKQGLYDFEADQRREQGREQARKAEEKALAQQQAAENAQAEKLRIEKERVNILKQEKANKEALEQEKVKELENLIAMRVEEKRCIQVEFEIAEKLRIAAELAAKLAAEEEARQARIREKSRLKEEKRLKEEEDERLKVEEENRAAEEEVMKIEDINMNGEEYDEIVIEEEPEEEIIIEEVVEEVVVEEEVVEKEEEVIEEVIEDEDKPKQLTSFQKNFKKLMENIDDSTEKNSTHERKNSDSLFFMSQAFGDDIKFDPFSSHYNNENYMNINNNEVYKEDDFDLNPSDFSDIKIKVSINKKKLKDLRQAQIYQMSGADTHPSDWTTMTKTSSADWIKFFDHEKVLLNVRIPTPPPPIDEELEFLNEMNEIYLNKQQKDYSITHSLIIPGPEININPLPYSKVLKGIVHPKEFNYYQIELSDNSSILTLELTNILGNADIYVSKNELPNHTCYDDRKLYEKNSKGHHSDKVSRIVRPVDYKGPLYIGINSEYGAKYQLWAITSSDPLNGADSLIKTDNTLKGLKILGNNSLDDLHMHLPRLYLEAHNKIKSNETKATIVTELNNSLSLENNSSIFTNKSTPMMYDDESDFELVDKFVSKEGRKVMQNFEKVKQMKQSTPKKSIEKNFRSESVLFGHSDVFVKPTKLTDHCNQRLDMTESLPYLTDTNPSVDIGLLIGSKSLPSLKKDLIESIDINKSSYENYKSTLDSCNNNDVIPSFPDILNHKSKKKNLNTDLLVHPQPLVYTVRKEKKSKKYSI
jgi:hypothetical protein